MTQSLAASYERCRALHRQHGRTYYLATRLLPAWKRRHVDALCGFARYYDDLLDYVAGSAVAIGTMMLPILGASDLARGAARGTTVVPAEPARRGVP